MRTHFRVRGKLKDKYRILIYKAFFNSRPPRAEGKRKVKLTLHSSRQRDYANCFLAADKLILDNLVRLQYLVDDSQKWLVLELVFEIGEPRTDIEISEVLG